jgi:hypothetical protein
MLRMAFSSPPKLRALMHANDAPGFAIEQMFSFYAAALSSVIVHVAKIVIFDVLAWRTTLVSASCPIRRTATTMRYLR